MHLGGEEWVLLQPFRGLESGRGAHSALRVGWYVCDTVGTGMVLTQPPRTVQMNNTDLIGTG